MQRPTSRRAFLRAAGGAAAGFGLGLAASVEPGRASPDAMREAVGKAVGAARVNAGKVRIDLPPLIENGNTVPMVITVDSPMTAADHVRAVHVFTEKNPQPYVASFHLGPRAGQARVATRIRLADSQGVVAIAELNDGSFWSARADVVVTLAACLEDGI